MEIKMFKAKVKQFDKPIEDVKAKLIADGWGGPGVEKDAENYHKGLTALAGAIIYVSPGFLPEDKDWYLINWPKESNQAVKEFIWQMEQDGMFGAYIDERDKFDEVWDRGEYDSDAILGFQPDQLEILAEIKNNQEVPI